MPLFSKKFMQLAINEAYKSIQKGGAPFGACIAKNQKILSCSHSQVFFQNDTTAHAEIVAIRAACKKTKNVDLTGCVLYSTCEPCAMCFAAAHWANIKIIYYGITLQDTKKAGLKELLIPAKQLQKMGKSKVQLVGGVLRNECLKIIQYWKERT